MSNTMGPTLTANELFFQIKQMPSDERIKFFTMIAANAFREDDLTHEQVFGHLDREPFSAIEAAQYLEVSLPTLRRYVQAGRIKPCQTIGRSQLFSTADLRALKRQRH